MEEDRARLVASDNSRLAVAEVPLDRTGERPVPCRRLLPAPALELLARVAAGQEGLVRFAFGKTEALFRAGPAALAARYVAGAFPPWRKALPGPSRYAVPVRVGPFLTAVRQAAAAREPQDGRLLLRFGTGRVLLESCRPGQGRARVRGRLPSSGPPWTWPSEPATSSSY